jgi:hypothetical protein
MTSIEITQITRVVRVPVAVPLGHPAPATQNRLWSPKDVGWSRFAATKDYCRRTSA